MPPCHDPALHQAILHLNRPIRWLTNAGTIRTLVFGWAMLALAGLAAPAALAEQPPSAERDADERSAGLYFRTDQAGEFLEAPILKTDVRMAISGMVARISLRQRFKNPSASWLEGVYVFPLPEHSAVDRLKMRIGERLVEGKIMEKQAAKATYRKAATAGRKASLVSSQRPNIFTTSVANIGPGEDVVIEIAYQDTVRYEDGRFSYRFPMVVAPRYIPGQPTGALKLTGGWSPNTNEVPDASEITPPVRHPSEGPANPVTLSITLQPGFAIDDIDSPYHRISTHAERDGRYLVTLADGNVPADRDFVLAWTSIPETAPTAALFTERVAGDTYLYGMILPPSSTDSGREVLARDLIFIIDVSGSMAGTSIKQARQALLLALTGLRSRDRFNIIAFNNKTWSLYPTAWPASPGNLRRARGFVQGLEANGGTNMRPALARGLGGDTEAGRLRQVVFLTDGAVGNEAALFRLVHERLGESRLFTIGIGSAPNAHFMRKAAEIGRGTFTYIGRSDEVAARMVPMLRKLARPALKDIQLDWPVSLQAETFPSKLPDLYVSEPVVFTARLPGSERLDGELGVGGRIGTKRWQDRGSLDNLPEAPGVAAVWARAKLAHIMDGLHQGQNPAEVREDALAVALPHQLVSRYTSLVAVDQRVSRPEGAPLDRQHIAANLPSGWIYEKVFGPGAGVRRASLQNLQMQSPGALPQTATPARLRIMLGLALILIAMTSALIAWRRRQRMPVRA